MNNEELEEIPKHCFENFILLADKDLDNKVSIVELIQYAARLGIVCMTEDIARKMFDEIVSKRQLIHPEQRNGPLSINEIIFASIHFIQPSGEGSKSKTASKLYTGLIASSGRN